MSPAPERGPRHAARGAGYGRYVGRVGALAVALGIGAAIANNPGIALAEDSDSSAGAVSADTSSSAPSSADAPGATADPAAPSAPKHRKPKVTFGSKRADEHKQEPSDESGQKPDESDAPDPAEGAAPDTKTEVPDTQDRGAGGPFGRQAPPRRQVACRQSGQDCQGRRYRTVQNRTPQRTPRRTRRPPRMLRPRSRAPFRTSRRHWP